MSQIILATSLAAPNSHINYQDFTREVKTVAARLHTTYHPTGLLATGIIYPTHEWTAIQAAKVPALGPDLIVPIRPAMHAAGAAAGTINLFKTEMAEYVSFVSASNQLLEAILVAVGHTIRTEMSHPVTALSHLTVQLVMQHLYDHYGTLRDVDYYTIQANLSLPFASDESFHANARIMANVFAHLATSGYPENELSKMSKLSTATHHLPATSSALAAYFKETLLPARTFNNAVDYVLQHQNDHRRHFSLPVSLPPFYGAPTPYFQHPPSYGYAGYTQQAYMPPTYMSPHYPTALGAAHPTSVPPAAYATAPTPAPPSGPTSAPRGQRPRRQGPARTPTLPPTGNQKYCYFHGVGHAGTNCNHMKNTPGFTLEMINAKTPTEVFGGKPY